tara:strand:+ start:12573 stop:12779 length:207 start_codon:yes stop_codon:yes gene_type:complete
MALNEDTPDMVENMCLHGIHRIIFKFVFLMIPKYQNTHQPHHDSYTDFGVKGAFLVLERAVDERNVAL